MPTRADLRDRASLRALHLAVPGGLRAGDFGCVVAAPGVGKTGLLVEISLDRLLRGEAVLHVALTDSVASVRDAYESALAGLGPDMRPLERAEALLAVERHRIIHALRGIPPVVSRIEALLESLAASMEFQPVLLVLDGFEPDAAFSAELKALANKRGFAAWFAFTPTRAPEPEFIVMELVPEHGQQWLHVRRGAETFPPVRLGGYSGRSAAPSPAEAPSGHAVLYSGGAHGAEAAFGAAAERHGIREVNYTFTGHVQARTRGAHPLTESELAAGDVSLAYVSRRLRRSWGEGAMIRRILQSLWHQVSASQLVFVVGSIQEDGTVTGGTGWSVELARMWNKRLWVYDQEKEDWYRWAGDDWMPGTPVIDAATFCGTGTRTLTDGGRLAIDELFQRSFGV